MKYLTLIIALLMLVGCSQEATQANETNCQQPNFSQNQEVWYIDNNKIKKGTLKEERISYWVYGEDSHFSDLVENIYPSKQALLNSL